MKNKFYVILVVLICSSISFFAGGYQGFYQGYFYSKAGSVNEAVSAMLIKRYIDSEKYEEAMELIELSLERHIIDYSTARFKDDYLIGFSPLLYMLEKNGFDKSMKKVSQFRLNNPPKNQVYNDLVEDLCGKYINKI